MDARWVTGAVVALSALTAATATAPAALATSTEPAFTVVGLPGSPVEPSTDAGAPTPLAAGTWSDVLGAGTDRVHYYSYTRAVEDSTVHVGLASSATETYDDPTVVVSLPDEASTECASSTGASDYSSPFGVAGAAVSVGPDELGDTDSPCVDAPELRIAVSRGESGVNDLPVALRVVEEARPVDVAALPAAAETARVELPDVEDAGETTGSTVLEEAPYLEPGRYTTSVTEGEQRLWRVRLDWGQQLSVRAVVPKQDEAAVAALEFLTPEVDLTMLDPRLGSLRDEVEDYSTSLYYRPDEEGRLVDGTPRVAVANRFASLPAVVPGDYWVGLAVAPADGREALDVPLTLAVDVVGAHEGVPARPDQVTGPGGIDAPPGYAQETPFLVGEEQWSADVAGSPRTPAGDDAAADSDGARRTAGLLVGAASLLCCAAGAVLLLRRRVSRPAAR